MNGADQIELLAERVTRAMTADLESYRTALTAAADAWVPAPPADPDDLDPDEDDETDDDRR
ncbi:hypothetical protein [Williamsia sp. CHRR-6]|uniref:hypothetical protein n=1 Tax=Williamsia sp. CHRR-6 TaxID=2835871 RepID=UPI001BDA2244|nr:hypothetical protein [Williamsia sp. CHRR-6]MBT0566744.1 hypothetical protein [Williamsia sp. CHRR-6]